ncbi:MAG TPA: CDP-alcohol phosphatidyltransferase family protein [Rhizomicrobium sp.]|nr:CDP-alcohol phosphatidyltransferase family protein [Rhizomicrobium sp.]
MAPERSGCGEGLALVSVYDLKPKFQNLLRPLCTGLANAGVTANQVTTSAAVLSAALGSAIAAMHGASWTLFLLPPVLFVRMALNAIDGMLAREFNQKSRLGAVLNELGDVVSDTALYLPFALIPGVTPILVSLVVVIGVMTEMAGVVAVQIGAARHYEGPFGKSDRAVFFGALGFALALGLAPGLWTDIVLGLAALAGAVTIVNRARAALKERA